MPYGDEITSTSSDREKFATYTRDSYTGLDYADQRFYASTYGRFNTADPYAGSAKPNSPGSWNRYSYTLGDPINGNDPTGQDGFTLAVGQNGTTITDGYGNTCQNGQSYVGMISGTSCLDDTTILQNSISSFVSGLGTVYDSGATFYAQGTASASSDPVPASSSPDTENNIVGPNYNSIVSLSATTNLPTIYVGGLLGGVAGPTGAFVGSLLGSMCGVGGNISVVPSTGSVYVGFVGACGAGVNAGSGLQLTDVEVPPLQDPNRIANGLSTSVTKVLPFSGSPGTTAVGGTAVTSPGSGPAVYGPAFGNRTPLSVSVGYNICLLNCAFR
jgi:RHS repeat-associated protein